MANEQRRAEGECGELRASKTCKLKEQKSEKLPQELQSAIDCVDTQCTSEQGNTKEFYHTMTSDIHTHTHIYTHVLDSYLPGRANELRLSISFKTYEQQARTLPPATGPASPASPTCLAWLTLAILCIDNVSIQSRTDMTTKTDAKFS